MQKIGNIRRFVLVGALSGAAALATTGQAAAKGCGNNVNNGGPSSVQQYREMVPTSCGPHPSGSGTKTTKLPRRIEQKLVKQGGALAPLLRKIATSEKYGAPTEKLRAHSTKKLRGPKATGGGRNPLAASIGVLTDGSDGRLIGLVALMACIAVVALGASVYRRRATR